MRRLLVLLLACIAGISCNKKDIEPITGYDSRININGIRFNGIGIADGITGYLTREYLVSTDSTPVNEKYVDSFNITSNGYNQEFHFNTPSKAIKCNLQLRLRIYNGSATSATVSELVYYKDKEIIFAETPLEMSGTTDFFSSETHIVTF